MEKNLNFQVVTWHYYLIFICKFCLLIKKYWQPTEPSFKCNMLMWIVKFLIERNAELLSLIETHAKSRIDNLILLFLRSCLYTVELSQLVLAKHIKYDQGFNIENQIISKQFRSKTYKLRLLFSRKWLLMLKDSCGNLRATQPTSWCTWMLLSASCELYYSLWTLFALIL